MLAALTHANEEQSSTNSTFQLLETLRTMNWRDCFLLYPRKSFTLLNVAAILLILGTLYLVHSLSGGNGPTEEKEEASMPRPPIRILTWTGRSSEESRPWYPLGTAAFSKCKPYLDPDMTCTYTNDNGQIGISDAVIFRGRQTNEEILPPTRDPKQKWIFYEFEPPYKVWQMANLTAVRHAFNLTSTYSFHSDIPLNTKRKCYKNPLKYAAASKLDFAKNKTKLVAWFVSICSTQSRRGAFVSELQKYIPVDIYGLCGPLTCGRSDQSSRSKCDRDLLNGVYKFYLSFENSLCKDYVTEKLWRIKNYDVIPVVMGGVDYANLLPSDTFINVRDFPSAKALSEFILYLDNNDTLYDEYIRNKRSLDVHFEEPNIPYQCKLCRYLHQHRDEIQITHDVASFWSMKNQCISPDEYFRKQRH